MSHSHAMIQISMKPATKEWVQSGHEHIHIKDVKAVTSYHHELDNIGSTNYHFLLLAVESEESNGGGLS